MKDIIFTFDFLNEDTEEIKDNKDIDINKLKEIYENNKNQKSYETKNNEIIKLKGRDE